MIIGPNTLLLQVVLEDEAHLQAAGINIWYDLYLFAYEIEAIKTPTKKMLQFMIYFPKFSIFCIKFIETCLVWVFS